MYQVPCPGVPSGSICDNNGYCQVLKNGFRKNKYGPRVQKFRVAPFCNKHLLESKKSAINEVARPVLPELRPRQSSVIKEQAKQIRNLEQKVSSYESDLQDYATRSRQQRGRHRRESQEFQRHVSDLQTQQETLVDAYEHRIQSLIVDSAKAAERQAEENETLKVRIQRHTTHMSTLKKKIAECTRSLRSLQADQIQLEQELERCEIELNDARRPSVRKRAGDPKGRARQRAVMLIENYIKPRGWQAEDVMHVVGKICQSFKIDVAQIIDVSTDQRSAKAFPTLSLTETAKIEGSSSSTSCSTSLELQQSALGKYLHRIDSALMADLVPEATRQLLIARYVAKLQDFWSVERCVLIKSSLRLSERNYVWLRQLLGRVVADDGKLVDHSIDNCPVPLLKGKHSIIKHNDEACATQGVCAPAEHGGSVSFQNARAAVCQMIIEDVRTFSGKTTHILKFSVDKAPAGKNLSFSQICLTLNPDQREMGGSPKFTTVVAIIHGDESPQTLWKYAKSVMQDISDIIDTKTVEIHDGDLNLKCTVNVKLGSDELVKFAAHAHLGPKAVFGCWQCELRSTKFMETDEATMKKYGGDRLRTVDSILLNAHMKVTDCCEGCGMAVVATRQEMESMNAGIRRKQDWKAIVVCVGDPAVDEPQPWIQKSFRHPTTGRKVTWEWSRRHKSIHYGGRAKGWRLLFPGAKLSQWVTCVLHLRQRTTALNVKVGVCQWLDRDWNKTKAKARQADIKTLDGPQTLLLASMFECFLPKGRKIPSLDSISTLLKRQASGRLLGIATRTWTGTACKLIERFYVFLLDAAFPVSMLSESEEAKVNKARCLDLFRTHQMFMDLFCTRLEYGETPTDAHVKQVREDLAIKVDAAGKEYVKALKLLYPECQAYYPHAMAQHCGRQIREHGSVVLYAQEADEAKNLETRKLLLGCTNHQIAHRLRTVMKHYAVMCSIRDEGLSRHLDRKHQAAVRSNAVRKTTTEARLKGKFEDLGSAVQISSNSAELKESFDNGQASRNASLKQKRDEATEERRALKKLKKDSN